MEPPPTDPRLPALVEGIRGRFRHIVIEGPIGVGKSTLTQALADLLGARVLLERPQDNPFLERFYADAAQRGAESNRYAFQTQLFFLFQRLEQLREARQPGVFEPHLVSDFLFDKDGIFARLTLSDEEYRLYDQIQSRLQADVAPPDLVLWLQAEPATLLARVRQRAVPMEQAMARDYLERLCEAYRVHFHGYDGAPVLAVDTEQFHPAQREGDLVLLLEQVVAFKGRRGFFNPRMDGASSTMLN